MIWHSAPLSDVMQELDTNLYKGLNDFQVKNRLREVGYNRCTDQKRRSVGQILLSQLNSPALLLTLAAALIWLLTGLLIGNGGSAAGALVIVAIAVVLVILGTVKEVVAENALDALRSRSQPSARVLRNNKECTVPADELVPGDIVLLKAGGYIAADCRLVKAELLRCDESSLTGEAVSVAKDAESLPEDITPLTGRNNMVYAGCSVTDGTATAVVVATGLSAEQAKIASVVEDTLQITTATQIQWKETAARLAKAAWIVCGLIFVLGLILSLATGERFFETFARLFLTGSALATTAVQETLAATITVSLAVGIWRLTRQKVLIHSLPAVETLSRVTAVCADKTGTFTGNRMQLTRIYNGTEHTHVLPGFTPDPATKNLLLMAAMSCDGYIRQTADGPEVVGDHTEAGIAEAAFTYGDIDKETLDAMFPRLCCLPFDAQRKRKTSVNMIDGKPVAVVKGAPDAILSRCRSCPEEVQTVIGNMTESALRVIAVAYKPLQEAPANPTEELEEDLIFGGLFGLSDPPLPEAVEALREARQSGIRVVMMTGDQAETATASALEMGLISSGEAVITGDELDAMTEEELNRRIGEFGVYVRLTPAQKQRVIAALQQQGETVAATGDAAADLPVLRQADVGCAMGSGTDVAKGAADLTVQSNSFADLLHGIAAARSLYATVSRTVGYALGCSLGLLLTVLVSTVFWQTPLLDAPRILWGHLLITALPVVGVALSHPVAGRITSRPEKLPDRPEVFSAVVMGALLAVSSVIAYAVTKTADAAFATLCFGGVLGAFAFHTPSLILHFRGRRINIWLLAGVAVSMLLLTFSLNGSGFCRLLGFDALPDAAHPAVGWLCWIPLAGLEIYKIITRLYNGKKSEKIQK